MGVLLVCFCSPPNIGLDWTGLDWIGLFVFSWDSHKRISQFLGFSDEKVRDFLIWGSGFYIKHVKVQIFGVKK